MEIIKTDLKFKQLSKRALTDTIVIHCSATREGVPFKVGDIHRWHKEQGWSGVGYHFVIGLNGEIWEGRPLWAIGSHVQGQNSHTIGICYIGGVDASGKKAMDTRTDKQKAAIIQLIDYIKGKYNIKAVHGHRYYNKGKACPSFDADAEYGLD